MILLTSGCSFSTCGDETLGDTWPIHLSRYFKSHYAEATPGIGNNLIARRLIYRLSLALKYHSGAELFVGVMWSEPGRHVFWCDGYQTNDQLRSRFGREEFTVSFNPTVHKNEQEMGKYIKILPGHATPLNKTFFKNFYDPVDSQMKTFESMLLLQNFLKNHKIKYFMCFYKGNVLNHSEYNWKSYPITSWYYDLIDWDNIILEPEHEWVKENTNLELLDSFHPSPEQHKEYTEQLLIPFIRNKYHRLLSDLS